MKFKIDENLPVEVKDLLISNGHDAHTVFDEKLEGKPDSQIAKACTIEKRILVTLDKDFSDIRTYPPESYFGIIVLRFTKTDKNSVLDKFNSFINSITDDIIGKLWIVEDSRIRIK